MLFLYFVLLAACAVLLVAGVLEQRRHYASLEQIPSRVLVNGIRGKSSITRLCAGALRGGGLVTVAKTTGTAARFIHPDATEEPVYRKFGIANVVEQIGIVRRAAAYRPDALVMECMAVMPALQEINQEKLIRSTIGVLCNVREDHLAEMGPTLDDVARSLSRSMPVGGICVTAERDRLHILQEEADARDCRLIAVDPESVTDAELRGFSWFTFKENVAIALAVAELLGVERDVALQGMYDAPPDPGVLSVERYTTPNGKRIRFANVFAANDPESTLMNVRQLETLGAIKRPLNVVINCRPDRVERNGQMGQIIPQLAPEKVFLIGHPTKSAKDFIPAEFTGEIVDLGGDRRDPVELTEGIIDGLAREASLIAIGNIHGQGELFLECLAELPLDESEEPWPAAEEAAGTAPNPERDAITVPISVARPPEPEPYSWVAALETTGPLRQLNERLLADLQARGGADGLPDGYGYPPEQRTASSGHRPGDGDGTPPRPETPRTSWARTEEDLRQELAAGVYDPVEEALVEQTLGGGDRQTMGLRIPGRRELAARAAARRAATHYSGGTPQQRGPYEPYERYPSDPTTESEPRPQTRNDQ
ncbi:poly-gamma-glutamate synthase PgsB [Phaeacidiphilus oryzae]|uniref:poly-gamma-glutamate synthase PgsB n=1 Tax=Phaeacidiphilus oryzae TaxID=348818 RepID=UPI000B27008E|nr:poly-gamma-glutamate synthase PgsB [Phaeacidiphilus oryzae]